MMDSLDFGDLQISQHLIGHMPYESFHLNIYRGMVNSEFTDQFYCSPIVALVVDEPEKTCKDRSPGYIYNELTNQHQVHFKLELWNGEVQEAATDFLKKIRKSGSVQAEFRVEPLPFEQIMLFCSIDSPLFACPAKWRNLKMHSRVDFVLTCPSKEKAEQVVKVIETNPKLFASQFQVKFSLKALHSRRKEIAINSEDIAAGKLFKKLNERFAESDHVLLTAEDAKIFLSESVKGILESLDDNEVVAAGSEAAIYSILEKILAVDDVKVEQGDESLWASVFWDDDAARPDRLCALFNESLKNSDAEITENLKDRDWIEWQADKFITKAIVLTRIDLSAIRSGKVLHKMNVTFSPVTLLMDLDVLEKTVQLSDRILKASCSNLNDGQADRMRSKSKPKRFVDGREKSFLMLCKNRERSDFIKRLEHLIKSGINVNCTDKHGNNALMLLCQGYTAAEVDSDFAITDVVKLLIAHGIDVNCVNSDGMNALVLLCKNYWKSDLIELVELLIASKINLNCVTADGWNALLYLCDNYSCGNLVDIMRLLIANGIDVHWVNDKGDNALLLLCQPSSLEFSTEGMQLLIAHNIDVNCVNNEGVNALVAACRHDDDNLLEVLQLLIAHKADADCYPQDGWNALLRVCRHYTKGDMFKIIKLLIDNKVYVKCMSDGWNALLLLCQNYQKNNLLKIIKLLIANNIDLNKRTNEGKNAIALLRRNYERNDRDRICSYLIENGAVE